jgi:hypothetical protein
MQVPVPPSLVKFVSTKLKQLNGQFVEPYVHLIEDYRTCLQNTIDFKVGAAAQPLPSSLLQDSRFHSLTRRSAILTLYGPFDAGH